MPKLSFLSYCTHTVPEFGRRRDPALRTLICYTSDIRHICVLIIYLFLISTHTHCMHSKRILGYTQDLLCTCFQPISLYLTHRFALSLSLSQPESHIRLNSLTSLTAELFDAERDECISKVILHSAAKGVVGGFGERMLLDIQT